MRLTDFAADTYSQFGEDGMIAHIFDRIGRGGEVAVEFGAADGRSCSNTARLLELGWKTVMIEGDADRWCDLHDAWGGYARSVLLQEYVQPVGDQSIDHILSAYGVPDVDFMSIDVDGMDYCIWEAMKVKPRVICIEYNQSIPPHVALHQVDERDCFGASAKALLNLGEEKGYELIGMNKANMFFVLRKEAVAFPDFETDLSALFPVEDLAYVATDYTGRPFVIGTPPWGLFPESYVGPVVGDDFHYFGSTDELVRSIAVAEGKTPMYFGQEGVSPAAETDIGVAHYVKVFSSLDPLIIMDVSNQDPNDPTLGDWVKRISRRYGYTFRQVRSLFVFKRES